MFREHEQIVLTAEVLGDEGENLNPGDVGTIVHVHPGGDAIVVEFMSPGVDTMPIATVLPSQARPVTSADITRARVVLQGVPVDCSWWP